MTNRRLFYKIATTFLKKQVTLQYWKEPNLEKASNTDTNDTTRLDTTRDRDEGKPSNGHKDRPTHK